MGCRSVFCVLVVAPAVPVIGGILNLIWVLLLCSTLTNRWISDSRDEYTKESLDAVNDEYKVQTVSLPYNTELCSCLCLCKGTEPWKADPTHQAASAYWLKSKTSKIRLWSFEYQSPTIQPTMVQSKTNCCKVRTSSPKYISTMVRLMVTWIFVLIFSNVVQAGNRRSVFMEAQGFEPPTYVTITGCNSDCDAACCNCDIERQPPMCTYCCKEETSATASAKHSHQNGLKFSRH